MKPSTSHIEALKPLRELVAPDARQSSFARFDPETKEFRSLTQEDIYRSAAEISLHAGVPETVRSHFATALNLVAYSWYFYPFNVTAELVGYVSVELALKAKYPSGKPVRLEKLLERAVREALITEDGFSSWNLAPTRRMRNLGANKQKTEFLAQVLASMRSLRNELAHGSNALHMKGAESVRFCAELINQLFPVPNERPPLMGNR